MEEGKENWQNMGDAFKYLGRCTHEARDSMVFCTRLKLHGSSQPPTLMWLSINGVYFALLHICVLE